jgi:hypothetical protein
MINIKSIWENHKPTGDIIIKTKIDEIPHLNCFAATNHITGQHLYIMSLTKNVLIPELKNYRFKGVEIYTLLNQTENKIELYVDNIIKSMQLWFKILLKENEMYDEKEDKNLSFIKSNGLLFMLRYDLNGQCES